jgi:hypothetical protein
MHGVRRHVPATFRGGVSPLNFASLFARNNCRLHALQKRGTK